MAKNKKKKINTFKNWLLARDSSSRISTVSNYSGFLESNGQHFDSYKMMDIFDGMTNCEYYIFLDRYFFNFYTYKNSMKKENSYLTINSYNDRNPPYMSYFNDIFNAIDKLNLSIDIKPGEKEAITASKSDTWHSFSATFDINMSDDYICTFINNILKYIIDHLGYKNETLKRLFIFTLDYKMKNLSSYLESAVSEFLKIADPDDASIVYLDVVEYSKENDDKDFMNFIDNRIKEDNIKIETKRGSDLLRRFGL